MLLVVMLIVLASIVVLPSVTAMQRTQRGSAFRNGLINVALAARQYAVSRQATVRLHFDDNQNLTWSTVEEETNSEGQTLSQDELDRRTEGRTILNNGDVTFTQLRRYKSETTQADWECQFYPNGSADEAFLELEQAGRPFVFSIEPTRGLATLREGRIADLPEPDWEAGDIERRA